MLESMIPILRVSSQQKYTKERQAYSAVQVLLQYLGTDSFSLLRYNDLSSRQHRWNNRHNRFRL